MTEEHKNQIDALEQNLSRALPSAVAKDDAAFRARLVTAVLAEVRSEGAKAAPRRHPIRLAVPGAIAAAAAIVAALVVITRPAPRPAQPQVQSPSMAGEVKSIYGFTLLGADGAARSITGSMPLPAGQWVRTAWGSKAAVTLPDKSALEAAEHTSVKIDHGRTGTLVTVEEGSVNIVAAKQPSGKALSVETPGAKVTVLGTVLDVSVFDKVGGVKETMVGVTEGRVAVESSGETVSVPRGTYAVVTDGKPPVRRSFTAEVNELADLKAATVALAAKSGAPAGDPAIVDFSGDDLAAVWLYVPLANNTGAPMARYSLTAKSLVSDVKAYSSEGAPLPCRTLGSVVEVDLSDAPVAPGQSSFLAVRVPDVGGLFEKRGSGAFAFTCDASPLPVLRLVELRLPDNAVITRVSPAPLSVRRALGRQVVTVPCNPAYPDVIK